MGTSLVAKYKNAELLTRLIKLEDSDDLLKQVNKSLQLEILDPLVCNEAVAQRLQGLVKQYAKGTCTSVGQMEKLKVLLQLITVIASFSKDGGLLTLLQHGLLFTVSEIILAAVQCVKGPRGEEALDLFREAMKTIRVMSDHSQKANEMVCEHYFHRITQLVTSEKFLMLRNEALNTVKYFLMGCPERIRVLLETKPKVKSYVDKLGQILKNTSDMSLQTEIIKVLSLLMVKVDRRNLARSWFDFDDDLDDFLQLLSDASNLDSAVSSFLHKFNCITYSSPLPPPPPVTKKPRPISKQPGLPVTPICPDKEMITKEKGTAAKKKELTHEKGVTRKETKIGTKEVERVSEVQCIPESEQDNFDNEVSAVPESQMYNVPASDDKPSSQQSTKSHQSTSKRRLKASVSEAAVLVILSPKTAHQQDDQHEASQNEMENQDEVAGTPEISGNKSKTRPTFITPKASRSSVILISRNQNTSTCSGENSLEPAVESEVGEVSAVSQHEIPDSNPVVELMPRDAKKVSEPIEEPVLNSQEDNRRENLKRNSQSSQSMQGSQESMSDEKLSGERSRKGKRGRKRKTIERAPTGRHTRSTTKDMEQSQRSDASENSPAAFEQQNEEKYKSKRRGRVPKKDEVNSEIKEQRSTEKKCHDAVIHESNQKDRRQKPVEVIQGNQWSKDVRNSNKGNEVILEMNKKDRRQKPVEESGDNERSSIMRKDKKENADEAIQESKKKSRGRKQIEVTGGNERNTGMGDKITIEVNQSDSLAPEKHGRKNKKMKQRSFEEVVTSISPIIGTPASVYDFQDDMADPVKIPIKSTTKRPSTKAKSSGAKGRHSKYTNKGREKSTKKMTKASPKRQNTVELRSEGEESNMSNDDRPEIEEHEKVETTAKKDGKKHLHQRKEQVKATIANSPQIKQTSGAENIQDDEEVDIEVVASVPSLGEIPSDHASNPIESGVSDGVNLMSPIACDDEEITAKQVEHASKKLKKNSKNTLKTTECEDNSDDSSSPFQKVGRSSKKEEEKSGKQRRSRETSSDQSLLEKQMKQMNKSKSRKIVSSEENDSDNDMAIPAEDEVIKNKTVTCAKRKDKQLNVKERNASDLSTKAASKANNINVKEKEGDCDLQPMIQHDELADSKTTHRRLKRNAAKKVKSYEEVEIDSFSQDSVEVESMHLSQADYVNARIDTPCPFQKPKTKKTVLISEKENSVINFSQGSREGIISQRSKHGMLWSMKKKPTKGYDKTYSKHKPLSNRTNLYDFIEHSDDDLSDENASLPTPSPTRKKSYKAKAAATKAKTTNIISTARKTKTQRQGSRGKVSKSPWTMNQMDQMLEECRKSLGVDMLSEEEKETRPAKRLRRDERQSDVNSMKTPVKSRKQAHKDDSIELPRGSPFLTPYLVDASPDMPVFNREEFMAEMRSMIQISDESSRADPSVSGINSPLMSRSLASPVITNEDHGEHAANNSNQEIEPSLKTPVPAKRKVRYLPDTPAPLTPTPSTNENFPEIEATPYQETWTTPVVEMPKSPTPSPPRLLCPEIPRFKINEDESADEEEQDPYSFGSLGRITPGIFQSGTFQTPSIDTPFTNTPIVSDKEDDQSNVSISEEIDNFSSNISKSTKNIDKSSRADHLTEMAKILQDEIKHAEEELLHAEQYVYMFVAFYENLRKRMYRLKQFQVERIQRLEDVLLKLSGSSAEVDSPLDDFEEQMKKLGQLFQSSFNPPPKTSR